MSKVIFVFSFLLLVCSAKSQQLPAPTRMRCDLLLQTNKVSSAGFESKERLESAIEQKDKFQFAGIVNKRPVFNWEINASIKQVAAYRILVASAADLLAHNQPDYWDSKKVVSGRNRASYAGKQLAQGKVYYWKVQVWNDKNITTPFSSIQSFFYDGKNSSDEFSHYPLTAAIELPIVVAKKENGNYFLDYGKDAFAQLQLHLFSEKTDSIWIAVAEALESPLNIQKAGGNIRYKRIGLLLKKGMHDYVIEWPADAKRNSRNPILMPAYIGEVFPFRYVGIENFSGSIAKESVQRKIVFYPFDENASSFISSDTVLNQVWDLCKYAIKATSFTGNYVDGDRERVPYEADALINQLSHYAVDAEYSMARRSMEYLLFHPTWPTEWSLQNVFLAWYDYLYTGDDAFIKKYYTELQKKILLPLAGSNGLISTRTGKQTDDFLHSIHMMKDFDGKHGLKDNVDWPQRGDFIGNEKEYGGETDGFVYTDYNSAINAWYYSSLVLMQKIAAALNKTDDAKFYEQKYKEVYQSFQSVFKDASTGLIKDGDSTRHISLHANMFALAFGLVEKQDLEKVIRFIKTRKMACSVYGAQFLLDALYDAGQADYALGLLTATTQRSWYNMIRTGSTITMEAWDKVYKPNLDLNHAWGAAPANLIVRKLMGVEPLTPGGDVIQIKPQLGNLSFASLKTTTLKGTVLVSCKKGKASDTLEVTIPGGTIANIYMQFNSAKPNLMIDGKRMLIEPQNGFVEINSVPAGRHLLEMK